MLQQSPKPPPAAEPDIAAVLKQSRSSGRWRRVVYVVAAVVLVAAGAWVWLSSGSGSTAVVYTTAPATRGDLTVTVTATGTVEPTNEVEVSSELSGMIASVSVDFNDTVKKGQMLAMLKTDKLDANVELAKATLSARNADVLQAQASLNEAAAAFARAQQLMDKGVATQEAYDAAKAANDRAAAAVTAAEATREVAAANLRISQQELDKACICSPVDGVVLSRNVEVGQTVASSLQAPVLFTLADDLTKMQAQVDIDEADVGKVAVGDHATFSVEAYENRSFPATISQIRYSPETVEGVVTYKAILTVDNTDLSLRPGMTATADIVVEEVKDVLQVSNAALRYAPPATQQSDRSNGTGLLGLLMPRRPERATTPTVGRDGQRTVWVLRDGAPAAVSVRTGATDGSHTAIVGGDLAEGDKVITGSRTPS
jgi:HlyD family secretion protein